MNSTIPIFSPEAIQAGANSGYLSIAILVLNILYVIAYSFRKVRKSKCFGFEIELNEENVTTVAQLIEKIKDVVQQQQASRNSPRATQDGPIAPLQS